MRRTARTIFFVLSCLVATAVASHSRAAIASEPLRVLLVGSSSMKGALGNVLESALVQWSDVEVHRVAVGSSGLARPDFFDWISELERLKAEVQPHVVVVNLGANDAQGIWTPAGWIRWGERGWRPEFEARVDRVLEMMRGRRVFWVGPPNMRNPLFSQRLSMLSLLIESRVERTEHAEFVDAFALTSDADGQYMKEFVDFQGGSVASRTEDGIHFTRRGALLIAAKILSPLAAEVRDVRAPVPPEQVGVW